MRDSGKFVLTIVFLGFFSVAAISQQPLPTPPPTNERIRNESDIYERSLNLQKLEREYLRSKQESLIRARNPQPKPLTREERAELEKILAPDAEDLAAYREFLKQPDTGIFRLFPDHGCDSKHIVRVDNECNGLISYKWSYSFRRKEYGNDVLYDLRYRDGKLFGDALLTQGILTNLGDVALEQVSPAHDGVKFLTAFSPELKIAEARKQSAQLAAGLKQSGYSYSKSAEALENTTYAMRLVAYRLEDKHRELFDREDLNAEEIKYLSLFYDKRADLTLAFRVVRKDANGSLTIVWKILDEKKAPRLTYQKNEKLSDINAANR